MDPCHAKYFGTYMIINSAFSPDETVIGIVTVLDFQVPSNVLVSPSTWQGGGIPGKKKIVEVTKHFVTVSCAGVPTYYEGVPRTEE